MSTPSNVSTAYYQDLKIADESVQPQPVSDGQVRVYARSLNPRHMRWTLGGLSPGGSLADEVLDREAMDRVEP